LTEILQFSEVWGTIKPKFPTACTPRPLAARDFILPQPPPTSVTCSATDCSQLWNSHLIKDTTTLERVQRHAKKYILDDCSLDYEQQLTTPPADVYTLDHY